MKRIVTFITAMLAIAGLANAATQKETTLWDGTYTDGIELNSETVATFKAGDMLRVYATVPEGGANFKICYKGESNSWSETAIPSLNNNQWPWINGGETFYAVTFTDEDITTLASMNIYIYKGDNSEITKVTLVTTDSSKETVTIGEDGIATFSSSKNLSFAGTGITPYYASKAEAGTVTLTAIEDKTTWGYQGYVLKGAAGSYDVPIVDNDHATYPNDNLLKGTDDYDRDLTASTEGEYRYILAKNGNDLGFYYLNGTYTLAAHRAYLVTENDIRTSTARVALRFTDGESTAVPSVALSTQQTQHAYTLSGQRVAQPTRGLYIMNGKKMLIK